MSSVDHRGAIDERHPIEELAEEFIERYRRGERPSISEFAARRPEAASEIRELFATLLLMEQVDEQSQASAASRKRGSRVVAAVPQRLGEYRIVRELGRGGMGIVYEAVQERLGRRVALKALPTPAWFDGNRIARFEREAQAAGQLQHAHIVPVYDFGEAEGVHFYTMQYIEGSGLDEVVRSMRGGVAAEQAGQEHDAAAGVDEHDAANQSAASPTTAPSDSPQRLLLRGRMPASGSGSDSSGAATVPRQPADACSTSGSHVRLARGVARLGVDLADALAYAHHHGVVHRDIKPSNVLLDHDGHAWITDFGLAKTENCDELTADADMIGTLRYMAPEQIRGWADPRTDVHGLGLVLYELLTLRPAFADRDRARLTDRILNDLPPSIASLAPTVPRDLETIVFKAIAKEPRDRYASAGEMAEDLRRFLDGRPIVARRTSARERLWLWCRRNRLVATLLATVAALMIAVATVATVAAVRLGAQRNDAIEARNEAVSARGAADDEARRALKAAERADRINRFLENMLRSADPALTRGQDVTVRDVLDRAAKTIDAELADQPTVAAALHDTVGWTYARLGDYAEAESHLQKALAIRRTHPDVPALELAVTLDHLARVVVDRHWPNRDSLRQALALAREAGDLRERELGRDAPQTIATRGLQTRLEEMVGSDEQAEASFAALGAAIDPKLFNPQTYEQHVRTIRELWNAGKREEALQFIREGLVPLADKLGSEKLVFDGLLWFAARQADQRDYGVCEALYRAAIERCRVVHAGDHPDTALALTRLATLLTNRKDEDAEHACREALAMLRRLYDEPHPETARVLHDLGRVLEAAGDAKQAADSLREALRLRRATLGDDHPLVATTASRLARVLGYAAESLSEVVALRREVLRIHRKSYGERDPRTADAQRRLAHALVNDRQGIDEAEELYTSALASLRHSVGEKDMRTIRACDSLAWFQLEYRGAIAGAQQLVRRSIAMREAVQGADHADVWRARRWLAFMLVAPSDASESDVAEAATLLEDVLANDAHDWQAVQALALVRLRTEQWQDAVRLADQSDAQRRTRSTTNCLIRAIALRHLGQREAAAANRERAARWIASNRSEQIHGLLIAEYEALAVDVRP